jgi:alkanesulfonate monooxygenase SsuD/methylene tetrahydromethanopterin reductase-like flavin-dependent oxidoreductase (luciferase family)
MMDQQAWGIALPQVFDRRPIDVGLIRDVASTAEARGLHSLWVQEQIIGRSRTLEPLTLLTYVAGVTDRIGLGVAVLLTALRQPVQLAKQLASLDQLSEGRLIVGLGLGSQASFRSFGIPPEERVARFEEGMRLMLAAWRGQAGFTGEFWQAAPARVEPAPRQWPRPPLWFGGFAPAALRRAARLGDGFIGAGSSSIDQFRAQATLVRQELAASDRQTAPFVVAKRVYIAVDRDKARADARLARWFERFYGSGELAARVAITGSPEACAVRLREVQDAGADLIVLNPVYDERRQFDAIWSRVLPDV